MTEPTAASAAPTPVPLRLHPWSFVFMLGGMVKQVAFPLAALLFAGGGPGRISLITGAVVTLVTLWSVLKARAFNYQLDGHTLHIREGLLDRTQRHIPVSRIQNVSQRRKLLHRLLGVTELRLESASGDKPEAVMRVLGVQQAAALEALLRSHAPEPHIETTGSTAPLQATPGDSAAADSHVLHTLPRSEILRLGLVSNHGMVLVAVLIGTVSQHAMLRKHFLSGMGGLSHWLMNLVAAQSHAPHWMQVVIATVMAILVAMVLTRVLSVALAFFRYNGFQLEQHGDRLLAAHGLSTQVRSAARLGRLQRWQIDETWLHRRFKRCSLAVTVAGGGGKGSGDHGIDPGLHFKELAPIATWQQTQALLRVCLPALDWQALQWQPLRAAWLGRLWAQGRTLVPGVLAIAWAGAQGYFGAVAGIAGAAAAIWLLAGAVLLAWLAYTYAWTRFASYAVAGDVLLYRSGVWHKRWVIVASSRLHVLRLHSSLLDRRMGVVHFQADTQGGTRKRRALDIPYMPQQVARDWQRAVWRRIVSA